jgi:hypothetical protein
MTIAQRIGELNRDIELSQAAKNFIHVARLIALGKNNASSATIALAEKNRMLPQIIEGLKAASAPGQTLGGAWGGELAPYTQLQDAFLLSLRNIGTFDAMFPYMRQFPMHSQVAVMSGGATGATISEAAPKVVARMSFNTATQLQERKSIALVAISESLARVANNQIFAQELARTVASTVDKDFIARLTTSGLPTIAASGTTEAAIMNDIQLALRTLDLDRASRLYWLVDENTAKVWSTQSGIAFSQVGPLGGRVANVDVLVSDGLPAGTILLADAFQFGAASSRIELDTSSEATIQLDTAPDSPPTGTTTLTSLWQSNSVEIRATRYWAAERLRNNAACQIINVSYGGSP